MTKLEQLIQTYCPDGVNYKTMGELGCFYGGITGKSKDDFKDGNARFITYKNVYSNPALKMDLDDFVKIDSYENQRTLEYGDVIFTGSSECVEECGLSSVVTKQPTENLYLNSFCFIFRFNNVNCMLPDFTKHLFRSHDLRRQIIKTASGVTRYNVSKEKMKKIIIPVPPLPIQEEIVRILDKFTELEAELAQKLAQEVEYRKQQYAFYRDRLLSFESPIKMKTVQQLINEQLINIITPSFKIKRNDYCESGLVPIISQEAEYISGYFDKKDSKITKRNYVCFGDHSEHIKFIDFEFVQGADGLKIMHTNEHSLLSRYLYHALSNFYTRHDNYERHFKYLTDTTIPVPSVDVQQRLVNVLDNFDAICSDLSIGLPAEIAAREKQYNYYRDLLFNYAADMAGFKQSRAEQSRAEQSRAEQSKN